MSIDWVTFIDSLDELNFEELTEAVKKRLQCEAEAEADSIVLTFAEVDLARKNPQQAAINLAKRLKVSLFVAKMAVEFATEYKELPDPYDEETFIEEQDENGEWQRIYASNESQI